MKSLHLRETGETEGLGHCEASLVHRDDGGAQDAVIRTPNEYTTSLAMSGDHTEVARAASTPVS